jgi:hypothetical protein
MAQEGDSMTRVLAVIAALAVAGIALPATSQGKGKDPAQSAFSEAIDHYQGGRYERALEAFQKAYDIKPTWRLLYNLGQCHAMLNRHGLALTSFERYLAQGGDEIDPVRRDEVLAEVDRLRRMVGTVEIDGREGDRVVVNGIDRGALPEASRVKVEMGDVSLSVLREGKPILERKFQLSGQETVALKVNDPGAAAPSAAPTGNVEPSAPIEPSPPAATEETERKRVWTWVAAGLAGAAAIGGGIAGGIALRRESDLRDACSGTACDPSQKEDGDAIRPAAIAADVMFGVAAAAAVTGIILFFVEGKDEAPASVELSLAPSQNGASLAVQGRF